MGKPIEGEEHGLSVFFRADAATFSTPTPPTRAARKA